MADQNNAITASSNPIARKISKKSTQKPLEPKYCIEVTPQQARSIAAKYVAENTRDFMEILQTSFESISQEEAVIFARKFAKKAGLILSKPID